MATDEPDVVAAFLARTPEGFERVYRHYGHELCTVARHVLGNAAVAEDCVHDVLLRVWRDPGAYRPDRGSLRAFLAVCVRNEAMSEVRKAGRRIERERRVAALEPRSESFDVDDVLERKRVLAALAQLPADQRMALRLAYYDNCTQREIADRTGAPLGTVKSRVALGLRRLGALLQESVA